MRFRVSLRLHSAYPDFACGLPGNATPQDRPPEALSLAETARRMREHLSALETRSKSIAETTSFAVDHAARGGAECIADVIAEWAASVRFNSASAPCQQVTFSHFSEDPHERMLWSTIKNLVPLASWLCQMQERQHDIRQCFPVLTLLLKWIRLYHRRPCLLSRRMRPCFCWTPF